MNRRVRAEIRRNSELKDCRKAECRKPGAGMPPKRTGGGNGGAAGALIMLSQAAVQNHGGWPQVPAQKAVETEEK